MCDINVLRVPPESDNISLSPFERHFFLEQQRLVIFGITSSIIFRGGGQLARLSICYKNSPRGDPPCPQNSYFFSNES